MLIPGKPAPELEVPMLGADTWRLVNSASEHFTLLLFYRGYHCPICKSQLEELNGMVDKFEDKGVKPFAVSMDSQERAQKTFEDWSVRNVPLGYELSLEQAHAWDLYISKGFQDDEPDIFSEPGTFLIRPNGDIYAIYLQNVPFARPSLQDLSDSIDVILKKDYPTRGTEVQA